MNASTSVLYVPRMSCATKMRGEEREERRGGSESVGAFGSSHVHDSHCCLQSLPIGMPLLLLELDEGRRGKKETKVREG